MEKKNKGGRPRRSPGEDLDQLTIRLSPKLKFGLELLSRAQNRSLSQSVEWALQVGLNNFRVNNEFEKVAELLDRAWAQDDPFKRLNVIYMAAPNLLSFEDRVACEIVERSVEFSKAHELPRPEGQQTAGIDADQYRILEDMKAERIDIFWRFVSALWGPIRKAAIEHVNAGKSLDDVSLLKITLLDVERNVDRFARMKTVTELVAEELTIEQSARRMLELDSSMPWSRNHGKWSNVQIDEIATLLASRPTSGPNTDTG